MPMKADLKTLLLSISLLLLTGMMVQDLSAQPPPDRNHRRERLETIVIGKFATELELTPEQAERFFPLFRQFREQSMQIGRRQHKTRKELENFSRAKPQAKRSGAKGQEKSANPLISNLAETTDSNRPVSEVLNEREQNQQELIRLRTEFLTNAGEFLTPQQVSRCSIMLEELPRKIHHMIEQEKQRQHRTGRPRPK